jgi:hypothetical protein
MKAEERPDRKRMKGAAACIGAAVGGCIWLLALTGAYAFVFLEGWFPKWFLDLDLADAIGTIIAVIAAPIAVGGWLFVWGDNGPPFVFLGNMAFNIAFGICFYPLLGGVIGFLIGKKTV